MITLTNEEFLLLVLDGHPTSSHRINTKVYELILRVENWQEMFHIEGPLCMDLGVEDYIQYAVWPLQAWQDELLRRECAARISLLPRQNSKPLSKQLRDAIGAGDKEEVKRLQKLIQERHEL